MKRLKKNDFNGQDTVIDRVNVVASLDFMVNFAKVVSHYRDASMEAVTFLSNVFVSLDGMVCFVVNVSG